MKDKVTNIFETVNSILAKVNVNKIDPNSSDFESLPEGYYLSEVVKAEYESFPDGSKAPRIKLQLKVVEDGLRVVINENGDSTLEPISKSKGRMIFKYYRLTTVEEAERCIKDLLKFEGENPGEPLLERDYFTTEDLLVEALEILEGSQIYVQNTITKKKDGETSSWINLLSWERATKLGLMEE